MAKAPSVKDEIRRVVKIEMEIAVEPEIEDKDLIRWCDEAMTVYADFLACRTTIISSQMAKIIGIVEDPAEDEAVNG